MSHELTHETATSRRALDFLVAFKVFASLGAMTAAITPAMVASEEGSTLRGSISAYWDVGISFWGPFGLAALLLFADGVISYLSPNRHRFGRRWYNIPLGVALAGLTTFNLDESKTLHYTFAFVFFILFFVLMAYTSAIGLVGRQISDDDHPHSDRGDDVRNSLVTLAFFGLGVLALGLHLIDVISFFFFELHALVVFALYHVVQSINPFPYPEYEFRNATVNRILRSVGIIRR